jgi:hypothetical protein
MGYDRGVGTSTTTTPSDISKVLEIYEEIKDVAAIDDKVAVVADNITDITTVALELTGDNNIEIVADNISDVVDIGPNIPNIVAVANNETNINAVAADLLGSDNIGTLADNINDVLAIGPIAIDLATVATISDDVVTVATDITNVNTVAVNIANVNKVADIDTDVTKVADIDTDVTAVANIDTNVTAVAGNATNINAVAGNATNINTVAGNNTNITTVAGISGNVTTVAGISANVTTVAGNTANINTVANNTSNINQVASDTVAINAASANAASAAASASSAATSATNAANSAAAASAVVLGNEPIAPTVRPSLNLDFANTKRLDPRITFTRTTTARYYDGKTVAKAEENLFRNSQTLDVTTNGWVAVAGAITANSTTAPDGTSTAELFTPTATSDAHYFWPESSNSANAVNNVTYSLFVKPNGYTRFAIREQNITGAQAVFDCTGSGSVFYSTAGSGSNLATSITAEANGYYRIRLSITGSGTMGQPRFYVVDSGYTNEVLNVYNWTPNGTDGFYVWGAQAENRLTLTAYTPTTTQPITNYIPVLQTAAAGEARFDHNPVTGESLGLLIEEQRANLLLRSQEFENATWTKTGTTVTANTIVAPDGTLAGDTLLENTADNNHFIQQNFAATSGVTYTATVFFKAAELPFLMFGFSGTPFSPSVHMISINLSTLAVTTASGSPENVSVVSVGNGWYRASISKAPGATGTANIQIRLSKDGIWNNRVYTGDGYSGIYIWGAQLEAGAFPTSYIPTVASSVTRNADAASMTGANFSSWYRADEGAVYSEFRTYGSTSAFRNALSISDGTAANTIDLRIDSGNDEDFQIGATGGTQADLEFGKYAAGTYVKGIGAYKINDFAASYRGLTAGTDTSGTLPVVSQMQIGDKFGSAYLNGYIKKIAFYPTRLTNAELQALTTV